MCYILRHFATLFYKEITIKIIVLICCYIFPSYVHLLSFLFTRINTKCVNNVLNLVKLKTPLPY